jgi:hypothetical protein
MFRGISSLFTTLENWKSSRKFTKATRYSRSEIHKVVKLRFYYSSSVTGEPLRFRREGFYLAPSGNTPSRRVVERKEKSPEGAFAHRPHMKAVDDSCQRI